MHANWWIVDEYCTYFSPLERKEISNNTLQAKQTLSFISTIFRRGNAWTSLLGHCAQLYWPILLPGCPFCRVKNEWFCFSECVKKWWLCLPLNWAYAWKQWSLLLWCELHNRWIFWQVGSVRRIVKDSPRQSSFLQECIPLCDTLLLVSCVNIFKQKVNLN